MVVEVVVALVPLVIIIQILLIRQETEELVCLQKLMVQL
jgi:hypothetical protein